MIIRTAIIIIITNIMIIITTNTDSSFNSSIGNDGNYGNSSYCDKVLVTVIIKITTVIMVVWLFNDLTTYHTFPSMFWFPSKFVFPGILYAEGESINLFVIDKVNVNRI